MAWPPVMPPMHCAVCESAQPVYAYLTYNDLIDGLYRVDMELQCGHRVATTKRKTDDDGTA